MMEPFQDNDCWFSISAWLTWLSEDEALYITKLTGLNNVVFQHVIDLAQRLF